MKSLLLVVLLIVAFRASGQNFRDATWGMSPGQVFSLEGPDSISSRPESGIYAMSYKRIFSLLPAKITYFFQGTIDFYSRLAAVEIRVNTDMRFWIAREVGKEFGNWPVTSEGAQYWFGDRTFVSLSYADGQTVLIYFDKNFAEANAKSLPD
jgi:hypothetical protein